jgi:hypothetical protein
MAQFIQPINLNNFDPTQGVGGLPIGRHPVVISSSEIKATKANDGGYLQLDLTIIDGPQKGQVGAWRLNLYSSSAQAAEIAHRQLSAVGHCVGVFMLQDSSQLHNMPFVIDVGPQKNDPQYTEVKKVMDMNGNEPGKAGSGAAPQQPQGFAQQPQGQQPGQPPAGQAAAAAWGQPPAQQGQQPQGGAAWGQPPQGQQPQQGQQPPQGAAWGQPPAGQAPQGFTPPQQQQQPPQGQAPAGGQPAWGQQQPQGQGAAPAWGQPR